MYKTFRFNRGRLNQLWGHGQTKFVHATMQGRIQKIKSYAIKLDLLTKGDLEGFLTFYNPLWSLLSRDQNLASLLRILYLIQPGKPHKEWEH